MRFASTDSDQQSAIVPTHVAVIMDGNGRWATDRGQPRIEGHRAGTENILRILKSFSKQGVEYLTLFAFSTENWERPSDEITALMNLLRTVIYDEVENLNKEGVRIKHFGRLDRVSSELRQAIKDGIELTKNNSQITVNIAFDYGGKADIVDAVRHMVFDGLNPNEITESVIDSYLCTNSTPDPDLIIRTAGEMRLSNFLLWQAAYAEYYSTNTLWPDFDESEVSKALSEYRIRKRRYGRVYPIRLEHQ